MSALLAARKKLGISQSVLAERVGMSRGGYAKLELGMRLPSLPVAFGLAHVLSASVEELFGETVNANLRAGKLVWRERAHA